MYPLLLSFFILLIALSPLQTAPFPSLSERLSSIVNHEDILGTSQTPEPAFTVQIPVLNLDENDLSSQWFTSVTCKAYSLDENWLLAGGTCIEAMMEPRLKSKLKIGAFSIPMKNNFFMQQAAHPHVFLIRVPHAKAFQTFRETLLSQKEKITFLAFSDNTHVSLLNGQLFVDTSPIDKSKYSVEPGIIRAENSQGNAGDPLLFIRTKCYWLAVKQDNKKDSFVYFSPEDAHFIASTLRQQDPEAYERVLPTLRIDFKPYLQPAKINQK